MSSENGVRRTSNTVVTVYGVINQFAGAITSGYPVRKDTTINWKHSVFKDISPSKVPTIRYFGIGINGFRNISDSNLSEPHMPEPTNLDLYQPIPFRMVPIDEDAAFDRDTNGYRMRSVETWNGQTYACYWLKLIQFEDASPRLSIVDSNDQETPYEVDAIAGLTPTPTNPTDTGIINATQNRIIVSMTGMCNVLGSEISEVCNIRFGDRRKAFLSEVGIYTGEEYRVLPGRDGSDFEYTEAIYAQLSSHRCWRGIDMSDPTSKHSERYVFENGSCVLV